MANTLTLVVWMLLAMLSPRTDAQPQPEGRIEGEVRIISRTMEVDGVEYAWSIILSPGAGKGGAGILFLHGAGECGTDGQKNIAVGLPRHVRETPKFWPFVVIVPQKPTVHSEWEDHEKALLAMLDEAAAEGLYDPKRLAITGLSQGGHGTIMLASMHPDRFRAAAPVCGYVDRRFSKEGQREQEAPATAEDEGVRTAASKLSAMPVRLFHGALDDVVPPEESRALHAAILEIGGPVEYTEFPEANHNAWDPAYSESDLGRWFIEVTK